VSEAVSAPHVAGPGSAIITIDAAGTALFALSAVIEALLLTRWSELVGVAIALGLFFAGCLAFALAYAFAVRRSRIDEITVGSLFLLLGPVVPNRTKRVLTGLLAAQVLVAAVTAAVRPFTPLAFGILVPVFGVGLSGLWAARHGQFPPRQIARPPATGEMEQNAGHG
jgi:hypothetical protein